MTPEAAAEHDRKATLANQWAREREAQRMATFRNSRAPSPVSAFVCKAPSGYETNVADLARAFAARQPQPNANLAVLDANAVADALAVSVLANAFGEPVQRALAESDHPADREAKRILSSVFGAAKPPESVQDRAAGLSAAADALCERAGRQGVRRAPLDAGAARILDSVFGKAAA